MNRHPETKAAFGPNMQTRYELDVAEDEVEGIREQITLYKVV